MGADWGGEFSKECSCWVAVLLSQLRRLLCWSRRPNGAAVARCDEGAVSSSPASTVAVATAVGDRSPGAAQAQPQQRRFWVSDRNYSRSDWYTGKHRKMIAYGCTRAPYYAPDPRCKKGRGFHHGIDIAMPCGTRLFVDTLPRHRGAADLAGRPRVGVRHVRVFRLRNSRMQKDFVIGHVRKVFVRPGDRVARGTLIARASDAGAPDGCHLHFEVRPAAQGYQAAVAPKDYIGLRRVG